jgi:biotin-(acetyl-CoA carboxylase) ligase
VKREELLAHICNGLEAAFETPEPALIARYRALSLVLGRRVIVSPSAGEAYEALAQDIAADGSLLVLREGASATVTAAEVSVRPAE